MQDIEAEDHILGPLTLRQFIYSLASIFLLYVCFLLISKHVSFLIILFLPPALFFGFLAFPFKRDQPTEVWALAKVRYALKPKKRLWSQDGVKNLVTITAPKKTEKILTNGLSQNEVKNRLQILAQMIDTRGWAIKNMNDVPVGSIVNGEGTDRLVDVDTLPAPVPETTEMDIFSDQSAQSRQMSEIINNRSQQDRAHLLSIVGQGAQPNQRNGDPVYEQSLSSGLKLKVQQSNLSTSNMHNISSVKSLPKIESPDIKQPAKHIDPSLLSFALHNSGLSVQTLANEANKTMGDNEVVVKIR